MNQFRGRFFLPGELRQVPGSIIVDTASGRIDLELDDALSPEKHFELGSHEIIHGELVDGSATTLLDCLHTHSGTGASDERSAAEAYHCRFWLENAWVSPSAVYQRVRFGLTDLVDWSRRRAFEFSTEVGQNTVVVAARTTNPVTIDANTRRGRIQFRVWSTVNHSRHTATFANDAVIDIRLNAPATLETILSQFCRPLQDLVTIATGSPQDVTNLSLAKELTEDEATTNSEHGIDWITVRFAKWSDRAPETKFRHLNLFTLTDLLPALDRSLDAWFDLDDQVHEVRGLATGSLYRTGMYVDQRFSYAAHAVETYHRRRIGGLEKPEEEHRERIQNIVTSVPPQHKDWLAEKLAFSNEVSLLTRLTNLRSGATESVNAVLGKIDSWERWVRDTRNYYTHFTRKKNSKVAEGGQLLALTESLLLVLDDVVLKELGLSEFARNVLIKQTRRYITVSEWFDKFSQLAS